MATQVSGYVGQLDPGNGTNHAIGSTAYGYCQTAAGTAAKVVDMTGFVLITGATIHVKFQYTNTATSPTLNVNGTGAKAIYRYGTTAPSTNVQTSWSAGAVVSFTYDGSYWQMNDSLNTTYTANTTNIGSASAGTAISADDITSWDAGSAPTLGTAISADDITAWDAGSAPALTVTSTDCDDITAWSAGAAATASVSDGVLTITDGTAPSLSYTARSVGSASGWSAGSVPSLSYTARSIPNVTDVGSAPTLTYTERSIPNITITTTSVVTGMTAS